MRNFDLDVWLKDKSQKVVDEEGVPVEILAIPLAPEFWRFVPEGVDPATCCTYHARKQGSNNAPVLCGGQSKTLFFAED